MPRSVMYPEGSEQLNVTVPTTVKRSLQLLASERRQSTSQVVVVILEDWLREQGHLVEPEPVGAG